MPPPQTFQRQRHCSGRGQSQLKQAPSLVVLPNRARRMLRPRSESTATPRPRPGLHRTLALGSSFTQPGCTMWISFVDESSAITLSAYTTFSKFIYPGLDRFSYNRFGDALVLCLRCAASSDGQRLHFEYRSSVRRNSGATGPSLASWRRRLEHVHWRTVRSSPHDHSIPKPCGQELLASPALTYCRSTSVDDRREE